MAGFRFRLASLLRLRESVRDARRRSLAEVMAADAELDNRLKKLRGEMATANVDRRSEVCSGRLNIDRMRDADRYEASLRSEAQSIVSQREHLSDEIAKRRSALVEADSDVRALEKLRETGLTRARDNERRDDTRHLDEVAGRGQLHRKNCPVDEEIGG